MGGNWWKGRNYLQGGAKIADITVIIEGTPIAKARPRFVRRGKFVKTYNCQETEEGKFLLLARQQIPEAAPRGEPVILHCRFIFPWPKSLTKKAENIIILNGYAHVKKPDGDNCVKFVKDCLNGIAWHDDSQVFKGSWEKCYGSNPRTELSIKWGRA